MNAVNSWVMRPQPSAQARLRLFCFPYAGGGASLFRAWPTYLPADIEVCSIQLPGRESRLGEALYTHLDSLVPVLAQTLQPYLTQPFAFFGHSLGALMAFELARTLMQQGQPGPLHLFVAGHVAPQIPQSDPLIHQLPQAEFIQKLTSLNGTPVEVLQNPELMELLYPVLRADFALNETYVYRLGPLLDCALSALVGSHDDLAKRSEVEPWREQTRGRFSLRVLPGDHFFIHQARASLLRAIVQDLTESLSWRERSLRL